MANALRLQEIHCCDNLEQDIDGFHLRKMLLFVEHVSQVSSGTQVFYYVNALFVLQIVLQPNEKRVLKLLLNGHFLLYHVQLFLVNVLFLVYFGAEVLVGFFRNNQSRFVNLVWANLPQFPSYFVEIVELGTRFLRFFLLRGLFAAFRLH
jgi:hypothetical protein